MLIQLKVKIIEENQKTVVLGRVESKRKGEERQNTKHQSMAFECEKIDGSIEAMRTIKKKNYVNK